MQTGDPLEYSSHDLDAATKGRVNPARLRQWYNQGVIERLPMDLPRVGRGRVQRLCKPALYLLAMVDEFQARGVRLKTAATWATAFHLAVQAGKAPFFIAWNRDDKDAWFCTDPKQSLTKLFDHLKQPAGFCVIVPGQIIRQVNETLEAREGEAMQQQVSESGTEAIRSMLRQLRGEGPVQARALGRVLGNAVVNMRAAGAKPEEIQTAFFGAAMRLIHDRQGGPALLAELREAIGNLEALGGGIDNLGFHAPTRKATRGRTAKLAAVLAKLPDDTRIRASALADLVRDMVTAMGAAGADRDAVESAVFGTALRQIYDARGGDGLLAELRAVVARLEGLGEGIDNLDLAEVTAAGRA